MDEFPLSGAQQTFGRRLLVSSLSLEREETFANRWHPRFLVASSPSYCHANPESRPRLSGLRLGALTHDHDDVDLAALHVRARKRASRIAYSRHANIALPT